LRKGHADRVAEAIGTGLYSGYFPLFPGTVGSLAGIAIYLVLRGLSLISESHWLGWPVLLAITFVAGWWSAGRCETLFGHDARRIVVDEILGMFLTLFLLPASWGWILGGFILFRFFDVIKPFPARRVEAVGGGLGVMLDDAFAGIYANAVLHLIRALLG